MSGVDLEDLQGRAEDAGKGRGEKKSDRKVSVRVLEMADSVR